MIEHKLTAGDAVQQAMSLASECNRFAVEALEKIYEGACERKIDHHILAKFQLFIDMVREYDKRSLRAEDDRRAKLFEAPLTSEKPASATPLIV